MKAMILAAGRGQRMGELTANTQKVLLTVRGKPLIHHHLHRLAQAGFKQVIINLAYLGEQIQNSLGDGSAFGLDILYSQEPAVGSLETAGGIAKALPLLGSAPFVVISGDIWTDFSFASLSLTQGMLAKVILVDNPAHHAAGDFFYEQGMLVEESDKRFTYAGIGIYHPQFFSGVSPDKPCGLGNLIREQLKSGCVQAEIHSGIWSDIGTPQRLEFVNN